MEPGCFEFEDMSHRDRMRIFSMTGSGMAALAWWIFIDAIAQAIHFQDSLQPKPHHYLPGVGCTIMFFIVCFMDFEALYADELTHFDATRTKMGARAIMLFAVCLGLASIVGAIILLSDVYAQKKGIQGEIPDSMWPGVAIFIQCMLLFVGSFVCRLGRVDEDEV